jgi:uncharacterized protein (TIGR03083 family)
MGAWDATTYEGKDTILRVVRDEAAGMLAVASPPDAWTRGTACTDWSVRDVVGHIVDTTEGYFAAFDTARAGADPQPPIGLPSMHEVAGQRALEFRPLSQAEMLDRMNGDLNKMMTTLEGIGPDEWSSFMVTHPYMGPAPAFFYAAGQLMDYAVHSWDVREGAGMAHALSGDAADLLVPFMFGIWQATIRADADLSPFEIGVRVTSGHNAGDMRVSISPAGMTYAPGAIDDLPAVLEFDAASLVLTTFGRCNTGTVRGDTALANRFLNLFYRI